MNQFQRHPSQPAWLRPARFAWLAFAALSITLWILGAYASTTTPPPVCLESSCDPFGISQEDIQVLASSGQDADSVLYFWESGAVVIGLFFFFTAGLIFWRMGDEWFALVTSLNLVFLGAVLFTEYDDALYRSYESLRLPLNLVYPFGWASLVIVFFFFPDGRLVPDSRAMRGLVVVIILLFVAIGAAAPRGGVSMEVMVPIQALLLVMGLGAQVYRYFRVSGRVQKQQTKWVVLGLAGAMTVMMIWTWMSVVHPPAPSSPERIRAILWVRPVIIVLIASLPLSIAFSILRYRLWDIGVIVRRTLQYAALTGILVAAYFIIVVVLQNIFVGVTGQNSPLVIVVSTLAIAALFNPVRRWIQAFIDHRFHRAGYDAEQTLDRFATAARSEVDLDNLSEAILEVVDEAMRPDQLSLWLQVPQAEAVLQTD